MCWRSRRRIPSTPPAPRTKRQSQCSRIRRLIYSQAQAKKQLNLQQLDRQRLQARHTIRMFVCSAAQELSPTAETEAAVQSLSLVDVMLENVQLRIHNVHFRVEDATSGASPFAFGLVLEHLTMMTTNELWQPT